jgi:glyceraldehyde 3-phosphate dehydrogenase
MTIAINGFGRIGRQIFRQAFEKGIEISQINDFCLNIEQMRILLSYDSVYGKFNHEVTIKDDALVIDGKNVIKCFFEKDLDKLDLSNVEYLIDSSGRSKNQPLYRGVLQKNKNLKNIVMTTYSKVVDKTVILGVNDDDLNDGAKIISTSTCDSVAILPIINYFKTKSIESVSLITLHPHLSNQRLLDGSSMDLKDISLIAEWRAAPDNLIPKKTSVESISMEVFPDLNGKINAYQMRIPTSCVSCAFIDIAFDEPIEEEWVDMVLKKLEKYYKINSDYLVSKDFMDNRDSGVIDLRRFVVKSNSLKLLVWYDNETGYSSRVLSVLEKLMDKKNE